jgi:ribonuclease PH
MREVSFIRNFTKNAAGSVLVSYGDTKVICTAMVDEKLPPYRMESGLGWLSSEYQMLPGSTPDRKKRKTDGRSTEISRLIGRSLRACLDFGKLGPRTIMIDCDVIQADGGTRTAAISGGFVALQDAINGLLKKGLIEESPILANVAAVSVGYVKGELVVDLDYIHDSQADVDMNVIGNSENELIEVQGTGEEGTFNRSQLDKMLDSAQEAIKQIVVKQNEALAK